jgi:hypothetical protein
MQEAWDVWRNGDNPLIELAVSLQNSVESTYSNNRSPIDAIGVPVDRTIADPVQIRHFQTSPLDDEVVRDQYTQEWLQEHGIGRHHRDEDYGTAQKIPRLND